MENNILAWKNRGYEIIETEYKNEWDDIVEKNINSMYGSMLFESLLSLVKSLNENKSFDEIKKEMELQDHSDYSYKVMCSFVKRTTKRGDSFVEYLFK